MINGQWDLEGDWVFIYGNTFTINCIWPRLSLQTQIHKYDTIDGIWCKIIIRDKNKKKHIQISSISKKICTRNMS